METEVKDNKLVITIDISPEACKAAPISKSGKSRIIASSGGFKKLPGRDDVQIGLNVTTDLVFKGV